MRALWASVIGFLRFVIMVMIIFNLIVFFNVKVSLFFSFLAPLCLFFFGVVNFLFVFRYFFYLFAFLSLFLLRWLGVFFWL